MGLQHGEELLARLAVSGPVERLEEALTHGSYVNEHPGRKDYEKLEFLGDAVLGLCVSELLLEAFPRAGEGRLTRMRAALVSTEALSSFARSKGLENFILMGRGALAAGDAAQPKVMADVVEAIVAAVYLSQGLQAARALTRVIVGELKADLDARDPKSRLQEQVQAHGDSPPPVYHLVGTHGPDHDRLFEVEVSVGDRVLARGTGRTKKQAEQEAAQAALDLSSHPEES